LLIFWNDGGLLILNSGGIKRQIPACAGMTDLNVIPAKAGIRFT
jgi:hypothetical protein